MKTSFALSTSSGGTCFSLERLSNIRVSKCKERAREGDEKRERKRIWSLNVNRLFWKQYRFKDLNPTKPSFDIYIHIDALC